MANINLDHIGDICNNINYLEAKKDIKRLSKLTHKIIKNNRELMSRLPFEISNKIADVNINLFMMLNRYKYSIDVINDFISQKNNDELTIKQ